jgi:hypothetical protein
VAVLRHDATLNSGNIEHHISGRNGFRQSGRLQVSGHNALMTLEC